jgi:hypothetical protein
LMRNQNDASQHRLQVLKRGDHIAAARLIQASKPFAWISDLLPKRWKIVASLQRRPVRSVTTAISRTGSWDCAGKGCSSAPRRSWTRS